MAADQSEVQPNEGITKCPFCDQDAPNGKCIRHMPGCKMIHKELPPAGLRDFIPLADLEIGQAYALESRNLQRGIWDGTQFHGIRRKFGDMFMDTETHWDLDDHYGTAQATRKLE